MSSLHYVTDGRHATRCAQKARRAVDAGRAQWLKSKPVAVEVRKPATTPTRHARTPFGFGVLRSLPNYRLDCTLSDDAWWMEETRREEDRLIDRLAAESLALDRMEMGLDT